VPMPISRNQASRELRYAGRLRNVDPLNVDGHTM
jgi:hypothetical protein